MKLTSFTNITYLISFGIHTAILILAVFIVYDPQPPVRSFQASVVFESDKSIRRSTGTSQKQKLVRGPLRDIPLARRHKPPSPVRKRRNDIPRSTAAPTPSLRQYITLPKPKLLQDDNKSGYLRANKRTEKPLLPLIAEKPAPDSLLQQTIDKADLSGSAVGKAENGNQTQEKPFVPSPEYSADTKAGSQNEKPSITSVWRKKSELMIYRNSLAKLVTANWIVPQTSIKQFQIMIEAHIGPRGNLISIRQLKSSGLAVLDAAAERAIRVSTPFPEFPTSLKKGQKSYRAIFRFTPDQVAN